jgi:hypothetical protein
MNARTKVKGTTKYRQLADFFRKTQCWVGIVDSEEEGPLTDGCVLVAFNDGVAVEVCFNDYGRGVEAIVEVLNPTADADSKVQPSIHYLENPSFGRLATHINKHAR